MLIKQSDSSHSLENLENDLKNTPNNLDIVFATDFN